MEAKPEGGRAPGGQNPGGAESHAAQGGALLVADLGEDHVLVQGSVRSAVANREVVDTPKPPPGDQGGGVDGAVLPTPGSSEGHHRFGEAPHGQKVGMEVNVDGVHQGLAGTGDGVAETRGSRAGLGFAVRSVLLGGCTPHRVVCGRTGLRVHR